MKSPFNGFANATLFLPSLSGDFVTDPETGNKSLVETLIEYKVILLIKDKGINVYLDGVNRKETRLRGYLVDPLTFPTGFSLPTTVRCEFDDIDNRKTIGTLEMNIVFDPFKVGAIAGQSIEGVFRVEGEGNAL